MTRTIVVPLDRSENAERALPVAGALARQFDADILLISVFEVPPEYTAWISEHTAEEPWRNRRSTIEAYLAGVASRLKPLAASTQIVAGADSAIEVHDTVSEMDDAILVMSTQGHSGFRRFVLGSKASRLIQIATYPVVVVPADCEEHPESISKILLPLDGSSFAEHALHVTLDLFTGERRSSPSIHLLRVVDQVYVESEYDQELRHEIFNEANTYLGRVADQLVDEGCDVAWEVEESFDVANRIVTIAHSAEADLISLATHGRTGFSRFFLGSVADEVLRTATRPVLVVRPSEEVVAQAPESRSQRI